MFRESAKLKWLSIKPIKACSRERFGCARMSPVLHHVLGEQRGWLSEEDRLALLLGVLIESDPDVFNALLALRITGRFDTVSEARYDFTRYSWYQLKPLLAEAETLDPVVFISQTLLN